MFKLKAPLLLKMDLKAKQERNKIQTRKRTNRSLLNANYKLMKLKQEIHDLKRQNWKVTKRLQRKEHKRSHSQQTPENPTSSQMRKANEELRNANLTPRKYQTWQSKLTFHNCLVSEIRQATSNEKSKLAVLRVVTGGGVVRHHKYVRRLSRNIKVNRKQLLKIVKKSEGKAENPIESGKRRVPLTSCSFYLETTVQFFRVKGMRKNLEKKKSRRES